MLRIDAFTIIMTVINLLVLLLALKLFLFRPVQKIIEARQAEADKQFKDAAERKEAADALKEQYEHTLSDIEEEKKKAIREARNDANKQYQKIVHYAECKAEQIKSDAEQEASNKKAQIVKSAQKEIADLIVNAATKVVGTQSGAQIDASLFDEFLDKAGEK